MQMAYMLFIFEVQSDVTSVRNPKLACLFRWESGFSQIF